VDGEGGATAVARERRDRGNRLFLCLRLNGYNSPVFIVMGDLILKQPSFMERALIDLGYF
jgi:hypothetical protein